MEPNSAYEDVWLRAETANENLNQAAQTQDADNMQAMLETTHFSS